MELKQIIEKIGSEYLEEKRKDIASNELAQFIRDAANNIKKFLPDYADYLVFRSSPGVHATWSDVPWIAFMDPNITTSTQNGYYVVYLFSVDMKTVSLCLGQGITSILKELGTEKAYKEFQQRAQFIISRIPEGKNFFSQKPLDLKSSLSSSHRPKGYEKTCSYSKTYEINSLPESDVLLFDLDKMLNLYLLLTSRGGVDKDLDPDDYSPEKFDQMDFTEKRKYKFHRVLERNPSNSKKVKKIRGYNCELCGMNFTDTYGKIGEGYIEAHHLIPIHSLPEGKVIKFNVDDFRVLCSNCHKMVHKKNPPYTLEEITEMMEKNR